VKFQAKAAHFRSVTGTTGLEKTLRKAVKTLATGGIPSLVCGGYAVQDNGYPRFTEDVDIIVPDVKAAREYLSIRGFKPNPGSSMTMTDRETGVEVDILPGGGRVGPGPLNLPNPAQVSDTPTVMTLEQIIASKLSSFIGNRVLRHQDMSDVIGLIKANHPPRNLSLPTEVMQEYQQIWDALDNEGIFKTGANMNVKSQYLAFELTEGARSALLNQFKPSYKRVVCHHITVEFNLTEEKLPRLQEDLTGADLEVIGYALGDGVEALVVRVNGSERRPDGKVYHITLSLDEGHKPVESNGLVAKGWQSCIPVGFEAELKLLNK
jgi:hypothetical protein